MTDLKGKIALVTGASRGLGYAIARSLGANGAHVIAVARTVGGLEELDDEIKAAGGEATLVPLDITDDGGLERLGARSEAAPAGLEGARLVWETGDTQRPLREQAAVDQAVMGIREMTCRQVVRRLGDEAWRGFCRGVEINLTFEDRAGTARFNGQGTVALQVVKRKGFNLIDTVDLVKEMNRHSA